MTTMPARRAQTLSIPILCFVLAGLVPLAVSAGERAERAAAEMLERRMGELAPEDLAALRAVKDREIVVVRGSMDHIEQILAAARIPHTLIDPADVGGFDFRWDQVVMVNCPGQMPDAGVERIARFVRAGGLLYTTDWALLNLVQKAFPGTIVHTGGGTGDHVTPVRVHTQHSDLMSNLLLREQSQPQWWLEGGSYPIRVLDPERVEVLASSAQMGDRYGAPPVVVRFRWDDGEVIHVVSHFYRQAATQGAQVAAAESLDEMTGLSDADKEAFARSENATVSTSELESSYAFQQMTANLVVGKGKRNQELERTYRWRNTTPVTVAGRELPAGSRLKRLETQGDRTRVRDDRGYEGWVETALVEEK
ncbi:MAG: hypothetical protein MJE66_03245 [Proteobacteria bacterium]|nr:hypothetical protein [Pseudomonadota bacterium]